MEIQSQIDQLITELKLPSFYRQTVERWLEPLAKHIIEHRLAFKDDPNTPLLVGLQGCQGSGKSTASIFLKCLLAHCGKTAVVLSIDDFYLTRKERVELASSTHPLLVTRGVPGTHDLSLLEQTIDDLGRIDKVGPVAVPRFDKAADDRKPLASWDIVEEKPDVVILEGWCIGMEPEGESALDAPCNALEELEDTDKRWRLYVNQSLKGYQKLYQRIDMLIVLAAPSFECVYAWRERQEQKLRDLVRVAGVAGSASAAIIQGGTVSASDSSKDDSQKTPGQAVSVNSTRPALSASAVMSPAEVKRFISHYQRLTEHGLKTLPEKADWWFELGSDQAIKRVEIK